MLASFLSIYAGCLYVCPTALLNDFAILLHWSESASVFWDI